MRKVKFVESLNVKELNLGAMEELRYRVSEGFQYVGNGEVFDCDIQEHVAPVHHIARAFNGGSPTNEYVDTYIAYSKEVQDILGMPFDAMKGEIESLQKNNNRLSSELQGIKNMGFIDRVKFMISGRLSI